MRILLTGATGLVGQGVARACLASPDVAEVAALVRGNARLDPRIAPIVLTDFEQADRVRPQLRRFDACFYCAGAPPIGTPRDRYRKVTLDATLAVARAWAAENPQGCFLYVSGAHADPHSRIMPLQIKGETEAALAGLPIRTVMLRPAGVYPVPGTGTQHALLRPLYRFGRPVMALVARAFPALAVANQGVGEAMIALARSERPPATVECAHLHRWARDGR